jgi:hypothetical protein
MRAGWSVSNLKSVKLHATYACRGNCIGTSLGGIRFKTKKKIGNTFIEREFDAKMNCKDR